MAGSPIRNERNRIVREAILRCRDNPEQPPEEFVATWMKPLVELAQKGDIAAAKELNDRIDGKAPSALEVSGDQDSPLVTKIIHESR